MGTVCRLLLVALLSVALTTSAGAQQPRQPAPAPPAAQAPKVKKPEAGKMFEDWGVECEAQPDKSEKCFVSQSHFTNPGGQRIVYFRVGYIGPKGEVMVVASLPLGIDIQAGTEIKFEPGPQVSLTIEMCDAGGCRAVATLDAAAQKALREAKKVDILMLPFGNDKVAVVNLSVKGLAAAFASLR